MLVTLWMGRHGEGSQDQQEIPDWLVRVQCLWQRQVELGKKRRAGTEEGRERGGQGERRAGREEGRDRQRRAGREGDNASAQHPVNGAVCTTAHAHT